MKEVTQIRNIFIKKYEKIKKLKILFKYVLHGNIRQLKILRPGLILKIHRKFILARKIIELVSDFSKTMFYVIVPSLKVFELL